MAKTGFIKIKDKGFKKEFSKKNINKIWDFFKQHFSDVKNRDFDWNNEYYLDFIKGRHNIPLYPETGVWDNSEGITPKQLKIIISYMGFENFKLFANVLSKQSNNFLINDLKIFNPEENIFSWKEAIKKFILPKIKNNQDLEIGRSLFYMKFLKTSSFNKIFTGNNYPYEVKDEIFKVIVKNNDILNKLEELKENPIYPLNTILSLDLLDTETFYKKRESCWMKEHSFVPKNKHLLLIEPKFWDKDSFLSGMNSLFKTKQLRNLMESDQNNYIDFYKVFGKTIKYISPMILNEKISVIDKSWPELYKEEVPNSLLKILDNSSRGIDIQLKVSQFIFMFKTLSFFKDAEETIMKKDRLSLDDLNSLREVGELLKTFSKEEIEKMKNISWEHIGVFKKYNIHSSLIEEYLSLYSKTANIELKHIPAITGNVDEYIYEILPKSDIRGLICGHATNCCQHLGSVGKSCTLYGAETKDSTFFIISKNGAIVAQSWLWLDKSKKIMVCDSVESLIKNSKVEECYEKMAKDVLNNSNINEVRVGASSIFQKELTKVTPVELPDCPEEYSRDKLYSDANTQYTLAKKK